MSDELRTLVTFSDPIEAELALHRLLDEGMHAGLSGDLTGNVFGGLGYSVGGMDLVVPESEVAKSRIILAALAEEIDHRKHGAGVSKFEDALDDPKADQDRDDEPPPPLYVIRTNQAFRASVFGFLCMPIIPIVHIYSFILLVRVASDPKVPAGGLSRKFYIAMAIDLAVFIVWVALFSLPFYR